jgi:DNA-binding transcriptional MocR family regulator
MGHNPTGGVLLLERRRELYAICSKYDVIIIEDDPYWYLQFPSAEVEEARARGLPIPEPKVANTLEKKSGYEYIDSLAPSFLNIDTDGRVVRLDTFSKTVAPGCRAGWITAAPEIVERVVRINESGTQHPSGFVESMLAELLIGHQPEAAARFAALRSPREQATFSGWQMDGWVRWLAGLRGQYERRMNRMARTLDEGAFQLKQSSFVRSNGAAAAEDDDAEWGVITKTQLYDFAWPRGGMFLWLHMRFETHPLWQAATPRGRRVDGTALSNALMIFLTHRPYLVLVSPGLMFSTTSQIRAARGWAYYRICFAAETEDNIDACSARFVQGVQRFWRIKRPEELEDILDEIPMPDAAAAGAAADDVPLLNLASPFGC